LELAEKLARVHEDAALNRRLSAVEPWRLASAGTVLICEG
jgi:hypothetical protein